ncbi:Phytochrome-like protein cph1 [Salinivirga cyanobacteriivorans]|uniref:histidine kinase n=1 Tax=Salinivirga cyanobacteriivorans TaxID=1307839 RepID=A0A0S2I524_9BACT|nr:PAS domain S-box protein [Salinivirga cyanobacteriivorans]ALO17507.1 Phytochrome-like protein cph1 [Salinivirga cyanobacteriivorans]
MKKRNTKYQALRIAIIIALLGIAWILGSDLLLANIAKSFHEYIHIQTYKGWFFVVIVAIILYYLVNYQLALNNKLSDELLQHEMKFKNTMENMLEGVQIIDFNWRYSYVNDVAARHGMKSREELLGKTMMECYPGIEKTDMFRKLENCMHNRQYHKMENRFELPDGSSGWFELGIQPVPEGIFILSHDITDRVEAEQKNIEAQQRLIEAQRIAKMGDFTWDVQTGEVTWSEALLDMLGYSRDQQIDYDMINKWVHHPDDLESVTNWLNESIKSGTTILQPHEYRIRKKNGDPIYVRTQGKINIREDGSKTVFATIQDITNLKENELKLEESEKRYKNLFMQSPDAIFINQQDVIVLANKAFVNLVNAGEIEDVIGKSPFDFFHPDYHDHVRDKIHKVREQGVEISSYEEQLISAKGRIIDVDVYRSTFEHEGFTGIHVILRDITESKRAKQALIESKRQLNTVMGNLPGMAYHTRLDAQWPMEFVSEGCFDLTGYTTGELTGSKHITFSDIIIPEDNDYVWSRVNEMISKDKQFVLEYRIQKKDGSIRWVWDKGIALQKEDEENHSIEGFIIDITDWKEAEKALEEYQNELEVKVQERTEELEAFAYSVSHDLRAPLRAINGFTDILVEEYASDLDDEGKRLANVIQKNSRNMSILIDDLLTFSRAGRKAIQPSNINMQEMVKSVYYEATAEKDRERIDIKVGKIPNCMADTSMMRQVWMNLLSNAIKYSSKTDKPRIEINWKEENSKLIYCIKDNGVGFNEQYIDKLFGVFQRLHNVKDFEGTGVGLALVDRIIRRHNGEIWAKGEENKGATFCFSIPKQNKQ